MCERRRERRRRRPSSLSLPLPLLLLLLELLELLEPLLLEPLLLDSLPLLCGLRVRRLRFLSPMLTTIKSRKPRTFVLWVATAGFAACQAHSKRRVPKADERPSASEMSYCLLLGISMPRPAGATPVQKPTGRAS